MDKAYYPTSNYVGFRYPLITWDETPQWFPSLWTSAGILKGRMFEALGTSFSQGSTSTSIGLCEDRVEGVTKFHQHIPVFLRLQRGLAGDPKTLSRIDKMPECMSGPVR